MEDTRGEVVVYENADGEVRVDVRLQRDTLWLAQDQMAELFGRERSVVAKHLGSIFKEGELEPDAVRAKFAQVRTEGARTVSREIVHYNLDAIISVGYRVNSKAGTQFRIWATRTLRDHLLRGYTLHERRLQQRGVGDLQQAVDLLAQTLTAHGLVTDEGQGVLEVVQQYASTWRTLLEYDEERLPELPAIPIPPTRELSLDDARAAARALRQAVIGRDDTGSLFGQERGDGLAAILGAVEQTFGGEPLYPSAQVRAAHLLYFLIKDHPFVDGNKRIGTLLFLEYLRRNNLLTRPNGQPRLADNAMVALALLTAESASDQKDLMIRLVLSLLGDAH